MTDTKAIAPLTDDQIDALIAADQASNGGNSLALFARIHERRRRLAHAKAKAAQPTVGLAGLLGPSHDSIAAKVVAELHRPLDDDDQASDSGAMDYLLLSVDDTAGSLEDLIFALIRVHRKVWAWNAHHLGPIQGVAPAEPQAQGPIQDTPVEVQAPLAGGQPQ